MVSAEERRILLEWFESEVAKQSRERAAAMLDTTRSWVDPNGYRLSDRLWNTHDLARRKIDDRIRMALLNGEDSLAVADELERYLHPHMRPARNAAGFVIEDGRPGSDGSPVLSYGPRGQYPGSYSTRRLMRTEITRISGQEVDETARDLGIYVQWNLSPSHPETDNCDSNAEGSSRDMPPGVYTVDECPPYPDHPHCMCNKSTYDPRTDDEILADLRKKYGLDHYVDDDGNWYISDDALNWEE